MIDQIRQTGTANLRISYIGGGYDYPQFFSNRRVVLISEGLPLEVTCSVTDTTAIWKFPEIESTGLGSSAASHLSFLRAKFPSVADRKRIRIAIDMDSAQAGGWQDPIAASDPGLMTLHLFHDNWERKPLVPKTDLTSYRKLYKIPVTPKKQNILTNMMCRSTSHAEMQMFVAAGRDALLSGDIEGFGMQVTHGWQLKKQWNLEISNPTIEKMERLAATTGAWGWKVCGAGGQGYFLVIGDDSCHSQFKTTYTELEVL